MKHGGIPFVGVKLETEPENGNMNSTAEVESTSNVETDARAGGPRLKIEVEE
jgi:hypothetical protein